MVLRTKLIVLIGLAVSTVAVFVKFGPVVQTTYFRTDIGGEREGLFASNAPTDFSSTTIDWPVLAFIAVALMATAWLIQSARKDFRNKTSTRREGSS